MVTRTSATRRASGPWRNLIALSPGMNEEELASYVDAKYDEYHAKQAKRRKVK